ncbi:MAG: M24 family metallopeptidase [Aggregatilineaceae bacterium]
MMPLGEAFYRRKVAQIQAALEPAGLDGLLLLDPFNVIYASGFVHTPSERPLGLYVPARGEAALFVPLLEAENAAATWVGDIRTYFEYPAEEHPIQWMVRETGAARLGVDCLPCDCARTFGVLLVQTALVERLRWIKEPEELMLIERAAAYADFCLEYLAAHGAEMVCGGGTELDLLSACLGATRAKMQAETDPAWGLQGVHIVGTVHSGPRAALPHGEPTRRVPQPGETLIAGIGAAVGGYHAESGATFILGEPLPDQWRCLQAAADCDAAARAALQPGTPCAEVNRAALDVLRAAGLGEAIRHRIGHGMGLQGHEAPWLAPGDLTPLAPGMVFSCEPGIYRPGVDGYRTINTLIVAEGAARVPSRFLDTHPLDQRILAL